MNTGRARTRKRSAAVSSHPVPESVPPPQRTRRRHELHPDALWDSGSEESSDAFERSDDRDDEDDVVDDVDALDDIEEGSLDFDDWDSPLRGLKDN